MAPAKTNSPLLAELRKFAANIGDLPYEKLLPTAAEAGWDYRLTQRDVAFTPLNEYMVTFDILVGREGAFEFLDAVSVVIPSNSGRPVYPISLVARIQVLQTLIYMFFNRLPPAPVQQEPPVQTIRTDDTDIVLPEDDGGEYVEDVTPERVNVIASTEPDGVPIFIDLYASGEKSNTLIEAVLDEVDNFLQRASSVEQINAMGSKNTMMIKFIKDLGTVEDSAELMEMITRRRNAVAPPVLAATAGARRRSGAGAKAN